MFSSGLRLHPGPATLRRITVECMLTDFLKVDDSLCAVEGTEGFLNQKFDESSSIFEHSTPEQPPQPHPMSSLSVSEIQIYLNVLKIWVMNQPATASQLQRVHQALSTLESFAHRHD